MFGLNLWRGLNARAMASSERLFVTFRAMILMSYCCDIPHSKLSWAMCAIAPPHAIVSARPQDHLRGFHGRLNLYKAVFQAQSYRRSRESVFAQTPRIVY